MALGQDDNLHGIRQLYPHMTDKELRIAQTNFRRYLKVLWDMAERLQQEGKSINDPE
jgi:hypothetical protein